MAEKKLFATRIDNDLLKALKHLSIDQERSIADLMEEAIREVLQKYDADPDLPDPSPKRRS